jgi:hypothetical protein
LNPRSSPAIALNQLISYKPINSRWNVEHAHRASRTSESQRKREHRAAFIAVCVGFLAALAMAWAATMWDKPPSWVPILGGIAIAIIAYGLIAPEP